MGFVDAGAACASTASRARLTRARGAQTFRRAGEKTSSRGVRHPMLKRLGFLRHNEKVM